MASGRCVSAIVGSFRPCQQADRSFIRFRLPASLPKKRCQIASSRCLTRPRPEASLRRQRQAAESPGGPQTPRHDLRRAADSACCVDSAPARSDRGRNCAARPWPAPPKP